MHPYVIFQAAFEREVGLGQELELKAKRIPGEDTLKPQAPSGDLTSLMTLAAVAAWVRRPNRPSSYQACCEGGD